MGSLDLILAFTEEWEDAYSILQGSTRDRSTVQANGFERTAQHVKLATRRSRPY
jgi:hypothetical protein